MMQSFAASLDDAESLEIDFYAILRKFDQYPAENMTPLEPRAEPRTS